MCNGKDEQKPHLHYPLSCRYLASRMASLSKMDLPTVLAIATTVGLNGMIGEISSSIKPQDVESGLRKKWVTLMIETADLATRLGEEYDKQRAIAIETLVNTDDSPPF